MHCFIPQAQKDLDSLPPPPVEPDWNSKLMEALMEHHRCGTSVECVRGETDRLQLSLTAFESAWQAAQQEQSEWQRVVNRYWADLMASTAAPTPTEAQDAQQVNIILS